jgi:phenylacetate-CoA ligase
LYHKYLRKDGLYQLIDFYHDSQTWPVERLAAYQWDLFKKLLHHAYQHVPYYREWFLSHQLHPDQIRSRNDLGRLPLLTKKIIRDNMDKMKADNMAENQSYRNRTSGSTGENLVFFSDRQADLHRTALPFRHYQWMQISPFSRELYFWGTAFDVVKNKGIKSRLKNFIKNRTILSAYHLGEAEFAHNIAQLIKIKPQLVSGYPSALYQLAKFIVDKGITVQVKVVLTQSETLHDFQRALIEQAFQTKVYNFYSSRDIPMIAHECEQHQGLHVSSENVLLEVIDAHGNPKDEGEGELVLTDLHNYAMPFIRYRIGDTGMLSKQSCCCGRTLPLLEKITGRTMDMITFPNQRSVGGTFWTFLLKSIPGIEEFQVKQTALNNIIIYYTVNSAFQVEKLSVFTDQIRKFGGDEVQIQYEQVAAIPRTKSGKLRFVISEIAK